jgi:hypothetical protein
VILIKEVLGRRDRQFVGEKFHTYQDIDVQEQSYQDSDIRYVFQGANNNTEKVLEVFP